MEISPDLNGRRTRNEEWPAIMLILVFCYLPAMLVSLCRVIFPLSSTSLKAGQPQPASNLVLELKRSWRQTTQTYVPVSVCLLKQPGRERISCRLQWRSIVSPITAYPPVKGRSVPASCVTMYCIGVKRLRSSSLLSILYTLGMSGRRLLWSVGAIISGLVVADPDSIRNVLIIN